MKVLMVANINSPHTQKWAMALKAQGHSVVLYSVDPLRSEQTWTNTLDKFLAPQKKINNLLIKYWSAQKQLRAFIKETQPDLLHAHYLTNYGVVAALANFHPFVSTAWGSDIFEFPKQSAINRSFLKYVLRKSDVIVSTSQTMKKEMANYTNKPIEVIPFGIDFSKYSVKKVEKKTFTIACFKRLGEVYGQDLLIGAFAHAVKRFPNLDLRLVLYGDGPIKSNLEGLVKQLGIVSKVEFAGWIAPEEVPEKLAHTNLCVYLSRRESFGVSLIEAMAAKVPLMVSNIPAFVEVAGQNNTVFFCETNSASAADTQLCEVLQQQDAFASMSERAYEQALARFDLKHNIKDQIQLYSNCLNTTRR